MKQYQAFIEDQIFWTKRLKFLALLFDFITPKIDYDDFETQFSLLFNPTRKETFTLTKDVSYIEKFQHIPESENFGRYMTSIYRRFEDVDGEECTEQGLKDYLMKLFLLLQNFQIEEK